MRPTKGPEVWKEKHPNETPRCHFSDGKGRGQKNNDQQETWDNGLHNVFQRPKIKYHHSTGNVLYIEKTKQQQREEIVIKVPIFHFLCCKYTKL